MSGFELEATGIAAARAVDAAPDRYDRMLYRRAGRSGLLLPALSLGAWLTFGGYRDAAVARECFRLAFDLGITHFDFANNYGDPPGQAEIVCGEIIRRDLPRDEIVVSSKAGHRMWPGPYGEWCGKKSLVASCEQSLKRLGLDYLDVFYIHRIDWETPFEESLEALDLLIRQGKVLYGGLSSWSSPELRAGQAFSAARRSWSATASPGSRCTSRSTACCAAAWSTSSSPGSRRRARARSPSARSRAGC